MSTSIDGEVQFSGQWGGGGGGRPRLCKVVIAVVIGSVVLIPSLY